MQPPKRFVPRSKLFQSKARFGVFGEAVTKLQHAEQAAHLARQAGADRETILAALLHDIGHLLDGGHEDPEVGVIDHNNSPQPGSANVASANG